MSAATGQASAGGPPPGGIPAAGPPAERCPLCGAALRGDQEWCLHCGAAARTRLAATPDWKAPLVTLAVIAALALGILAAALVKLAGDSGPAPSPRTTTVTSAGPAPAAPTTAATAALPPSSSTAGSPASAGGTTAPGVAGARTATTPPTHTATGAQAILEEVERTRALRKGTAGR